MKDYLNCLVCSGDDISIEEANERLMEHNLPLIKIDKNAVLCEVCSNPLKERTEQ